MSISKALMVSLGGCRDETYKICDSVRGSSWIGRLRRRPRAVLSICAERSAMSVGLRTGTARLESGACQTSRSGRGRLFRVPGAWLRRLSGRGIIRTAASSVPATRSDGSADARFAARTRRDGEGLCLSTGRRGAARRRKYLPRALIFSAALGLAACDEAQRAVDETARAAAKSAVAETLVTQFPQVPKASVTPFTDCIIDNASAGEIAEFARDSVVGVSETTIILIRTVLQRPGTQSCVARAGLAALGV